MAQDVKASLGIAIASVKAPLGVAVASVKTMLGIDNTSASDTEFVTGVSLGATASPAAQYGMEIVVGGAGITVTEVGIYGNATHYSATMDVYVRSSTGTDLGHATVTWGTGAQFYYATLSSPISLSASTTYYIMSDSIAFNDIYGGATTVTTTGVASVTASAFDQPPTPEASTAGHCYCPLSFKYH